MIESDTEQTPAPTEDQPINADRKPDPFWDLKASHWATVLLTCALVGVGIAQYRVYSRQAGIMNGQQEVMQRQLAESQAEQRAWVPLTGATIFRMSADANGIRMEFNFVLKNSGKDPAVNSFVNVDASLSKRPDVSWESAVCNKPSNDVGVGVSVFPGDQVGVAQTGYLEAAEVAQVTKPFPSGTESITPFIVACAVYKDAVTDKWHHTPYAFHLQMKAVKPPRGCCAILLKDLPINADELVLPVWPAAMSPD